ncbi:hypothetical protein EON82_23140 [bacterium]|nr:MAG: hypothetical protein EON82_23140 [bacterium]
MRTSLACGSVINNVPPSHLNGNTVSTINSRLLAAAEAADATKLRANQELSFLGGKLVGVGLSMPRERALSLISLDATNGRVLRPYLGGEEVNTSASATPDRYMIDFSDLSLEEARQWPSLLEIVEREVRPAREKDKRGTYKTYWWRPGESGRSLYRALGARKRCLVACVVTKHLVFSFQSTDCFFAQTLCIFPFDHFSPFAVLQSRIHERWARLLSSTMEDRLRYAASDCFETFPFPSVDPRSAHPALEAAGEMLYRARAVYMLGEQVGLTKTYNALKEPAITEPRVVHLRALHEALDAAVLAAYGWSDIAVPPFCVASAADRRALDLFESQVLARLVALNAARAAAERRS